jgi:N-acetylmuramoyl-L-alanine amidase
MRLYRRGDQGEPVRDIQGRLSALGHSCEPDAHGDFADGTRSAVMAFQETRGLDTDGIVGPATWRALVRSGYRLGDRLLYHRVPMMRGDDVAELQRRLNSLGFDTGKVDGIFGPDTLTGVLDFQSNRQMAEDGIAGDLVVAELELMARATSKHGRELVRERQWLRALPHHLAGQRIYVDAFCRDDAEADAAWRAATTFAKIIQDLGATPVLSRAIDTRPTERVRALRANRLGVDFVISFSHPRDGQEAALYFASPHSRSSAGHALSRSVATTVGVEPLGRAIPMLKNTRSPAVVIAVSSLDEKTGGSAAQGVINLFATLADDRISTEE